MAPALARRESAAVDVFGEAVAYYTGLQGQGEIESFEIVFLDPHGGDLGGSFLLRGDAAKLGRGAHERRVRTGQH